jgi:hypothetical protein
MDGDPIHISRRQRMRRSTLVISTILFLLTGTVSLYGQGPASEVTIAMMCSGPKDVTATTFVTVTVGGVTKTETLYCSGGPPLSNPNADCASCHGAANPTTPGRASAKSIPLAEGETVTFWEVITSVGSHGVNQKGCLPGSGDSIPAQSVCRNENYGAAVHIN